MDAPELLINIYRADPKVNDEQSGFKVIVVRALSSLLNSGEADLFYAGYIPHPEPDATEFDPRGFTINLQMRSSRGKAEDADWQPILDHFTGFLKDEGADKTDISLHTDASFQTTAIIHIHCPNADSRLKPNQCSDFSRK